MSFNPKPNIKVYVTIQLCEPYAELYYIFRRLKHYKVISNYRLDENGSTQIALSPTTQSFKFTGLDKLAVLQVQIPPQINDEINYRRGKKQQNEEKSRNLNLEKARKARPNPPSSQQTSSSVAPSTRPPMTGSNSVPVQARVSSVPGHGYTGCPIIKFNFLIYQFLSRLTLLKDCSVLGIHVLISAFKRTML